MSIEEIANLELTELLKEVDRFEIIDKSGRLLTYRGKVTASLQDNQKTLKIFLFDLL